MSTQSKSASHLPVRLPPRWPLLLMGAGTLAVGALATIAFDRQAESLASLANRWQPLPAGSNAPPTAASEPADATDGLESVVQSLATKSAVIEKGAAESQKIAAWRQLGATGSSARELARAAQASDFWHRRARLLVDALQKSQDVRARIGGLTTAAMNDLAPNGDVGSASSADARMQQARQHRSELGDLIGSLAASGDVQLCLLLGLNAERYGVCLWSNQPALVGRTFASSRLLAAAVERHGLVEGFDLADGSLVLGAAAPLKSTLDIEAAVLLCGSPVDAGSMQALGEELQGVAGLAIFDGAAREGQGAEPAVSSGADNPAASAAAQPLPEGLATGLQSRLFAMAEEATARGETFDFRSSRMQACETRFSEIDSHPTVTYYQGLPSFDGGLVGILAVSRTDPAAGGEVAPGDHAPPSLHDEIVALQAVGESLRAAQAARSERSAASAGADAAADATRADAAATVEQLRQGALQSRQTIFRALGGVAGLFLVLLATTRKRAVGQVASKLGGTAERTAEEVSAAEQNRPQESAAAGENNASRAPASPPDRVPAPAAAPPAPAPAAPKKKRGARDVNPDLAKSVPLEKVNGAVRAVLASKLFEGQSALLAIDDRETQRLVSRVLGKSGAEVTAADPGQLADHENLAALARSQAFDIVVVEAHSPDLGGLATIAGLRSRGFRGRIVGLISADASRLRDLVLEAGADDCVAKPIDYSRLLCATLGSAATPILSRSI